MAGVSMQTISGKGAEGPAKPFILSEGLPPVPSKLVVRILHGDLIDMVELLWDSLEAQRREALQETSMSAGTPRSRHQVPDLLSWVHCFSIYTTVVASTFTERVQELLAYQMLIIREAGCGVDHQEDW